MHINVYAIILAAIANFIVCMVWYGGLFMKPWAAEMGYDPTMRPQGKMMARNMLIMAASCFIFAWIFAFYLAGWKFIPGMESMGTFSFGFNSALSVWIGFLLTSQLHRVVWERHSLKLFAINAGYNLVAAIVVGMILASWP